MNDEHFFIEPDTDAGIVARMTLQERVDRAIALLKKHEPAEGYYLAYSGGKDSDTCKKLLQLSGVKFESWYNQTTVDAPELVRHVKSQPDVKWNLAETNMMTAVANWNKPPPTRNMRWCCEKFKERGGDGRVCVFGVRASESKRRQGMWRETRDDHSSKRFVVCPVVYWEDEHVWEFLKHYEVKYCQLYDEEFEGKKWDRLGCVDCPLASTEKRQRERRRWPRMGENWRKAVMANWERMSKMTRLDGKPYFHAKFKSAEDFYQWWLGENKHKNIWLDDCQTGLLWTNERMEDEGDKSPS